MFWNVAGIFWYRFTDIPEEGTASVFRYWCRQHDTPKLWQISTKLPRVTSVKTVTFMDICLRISNLLPNYLFEWNKLCFYSVRSRSLFLLSILYDHVYFVRSWRWRRHVPPKRQLTFKRATRRYTPEDSTLQVYFDKEREWFFCSKIFHTPVIFCPSVLIDPLIFSQSCHFWLKIVPINRVSLRQHPAGVKLCLSVAVSPYNPRRQQCILSTDTCCKVTSDRTDPKTITNL
jgi:hypothetical protein